MRLPHEDGVAWVDLTRAISETPQKILREQPELTCVWVQTDTKPDLIKALEHGFIPANKLDSHRPVLVFTRWMLQRQQGGNGNG